MSSLKRVVQFSQLGVRHISRSQTTLASEKKIVDYSKLKAKQDKFQMDDGQPIHMKGGILDKLLFQATVVLCVVGVGLSGKVFYDLSYPKKN